ncbi:MAG: GntR family transcriptional regulator [Lachnospiraceae bacterium]|nr:GntR family transcriptional regulator [Lachnospiraceae bacterium]MBP3576902.1 GntR family transcriptional regulator [Lachnospiraceae bacterium]
MISFNEFTMQEGSPIYQQILLYIKRGVIAGTIVDGDELPSRRVLSALLGVNPNTVQKAYRLLEEEKLIESLQGSKSTMVLTAEKIAVIREELLEADAKGAVQKLKQMGISKAEAIALIEKYWEDGTVAESGE